MGIELETSLLFFSTVFLGCASGTFTTLEIFSCVHPDKNSGEDWWNRGYARLLSEKPIEASLFLQAIRGITIILTAGLSIHIGAGHIFKSLHQFPLFASITLLVIILCYLPQSIFSYLAMRDSQKFINATRFIMHPLLLVCLPLTSLIGRLSTKAFPRLIDSMTYRIRPLGEKISMFGGENGFLEEEERKLMSSILDFGETKVKEVMVPRIDIVAVSMDMSKEEALRTIIEAGHSRIPVFDETIDRITGVVYTKDLLRKTVAGEDVNLEKIAREPFFVPESKKIDELLGEFKARKKHIAIAVDEYGGTAGLVTLEDILEELVGDIQDEFDSEEELIKRVDEDSAICNAKVHLDELRENLGLVLPQGEADSLGGFLYEKIGRVPRVGDVIRWNGVSYEIRSIVRQRIGKVLIKGLKSLGEVSENET